MWAEEYRRASDATRAFPEETARVVAARVASEQGLVAKLLWAERRAHPPAELTPYGGILASYQFFFNRDPADLGPAIEALRRVRRRGARVQPGLGPAVTPLQHELHVRAHAPRDSHRPGRRLRAERGAPRHRPSQRARAALAGALLVKGELAAARAEVESALELNPDSLVYLEWIGWLMTLLGEWERGPALLRRALDLNPHVIPVAQHAFWLAHLHRGEFEEAYQAALQYRDPTFFLRAMMRACCLGHLGRLEEAKLEVAELLATKPDFPSRGRTLIGRHVKFPDLLESVVGGLEKAGLQLDRE